MATNTQARNLKPLDGVAAAVWALFIVACFLPCIDCGPDLQSGDPGFPDLEKELHVGLELLLFGHSGGNNGVPWSANVFLMAGLICLRWGQLRSAFLFGLIGTVLGLTTWWVRRGDQLLIGYYLWQASLVVLAVGAGYRWRTAGVQPSDQPVPVDISLRRSA